MIGDVGGTNARFAIVDANGAPAEVAALSCGDYADLVEAVDAYLDRLDPPQRPDAAAIAIASPVDGDRVRMTNHRWSFSIAEVRDRLGLATLHVVNDFVAIALAIPALGPGDRRAVGGGAPCAGAPIAAIGPGTGLGMSGLVPNGEDWIPLATEGGHATLAAADARERAVVERLAARFGHVSFERAVSGAGLVNLAQAIASIDGLPAPPDDPAEVSARALAGTDPLAVAALDMFCAMLGTAASNLALSLGAKGGVYIAGGIVPRLGETFARSPFRARFEDKGRYRSYLAAIPTYVVTRAEPALLGLAALIRRPPGR